MTIIIPFLVAAGLIIIFGAGAVIYMAAAHSYARRVNAECREYLAHALGAPVPVEPEPLTDEERRNLARVNAYIRAILDFSRPPSRRERLAMHIAALRMRVSNSPLYGRILGILGILITTPTLPDHT